MDNDNLIAAVLAATGWSQAELARRVGVHKDTVQDWRQGRSTPRGAVYAELAAELRADRRRIDDVLAALDKARVGTGIL